MPGNPQPNDLLEFRVETLERDRDEIKRAVISIDESLKMLTRLELHHAETQEAMKRAFNSINDHETRLRPIEADLPTLRMVRGWVIAGVLGVCSLLGIAVISLVISSHA